MSAQTKDGVLQVMEGAQSLLYGAGAYIAHDQMLDARRVVTELIDANVGEYEADYNYQHAATGSPRNEAWKALVAAREKRRIALCAALGKTP